MTEINFLSAQEQDSIHRLSNAGYKTVFDIVKTNRAHFLNSVPDIDTSKARQIYHRARDHAETLKSLFRSFQLRQEPVISGIQKLSSSATIRTNLMGNISDDSDFSGLLDRSKDYADVASIQSLFSQGRYAVSLYAVAKKLYAENFPLAIDNRRPDLKNLILSETSMTQEVPALDILLNVLQAGTNASTETLSQAYFPMTLPYDDYLCQIYAALAAQGRTLNGVWEALTDIQRLSFMFPDYLGTFFQHLPTMAGNDTENSIDGSAFYMEANGKMVWLVIDPSHSAAGLGAKLVLGEPNSTDKRVAQLKFTIVSRGEYEALYLGFGDVTPFIRTVLKNAYLTGMDNEHDSKDGRFVFLVNKNTGATANVNDHLSITLLMNDDRTIIFRTSSGYIGLDNNANSPEEQNALVVDARLEDALKFTLCADATGKAAMNPIAMLPEALLLPTSPNPPVRTVLSLTPVSYQLMVNETLGSQDIVSHFGLNSNTNQTEADIAQTLNDISIFCEKTGLTFNEILALTAQANYDHTVVDINNLSLFYKYGTKTREYVWKYGAAFLNSGLKDIQQPDQRILEVVQFQPSDKKGTFLNPRNWEDNEPGEKGDVYKGQVAYFILRQTGNPKISDWQYPMNEKDNDHWYYAGTHAGTWEDPKNWGEYGLKGSIYKYDFNGLYYGLKEAGRPSEENRWYCPKTAVSNDHFEYLMDDPNKSPRLNFQNDTVVALASHAEKLIRLKRTTGLTFEELDWIITNASLTNGYKNASLNANVLRALGSYVVLKKLHGISVDTFVSFIGAVNPYAKQQEKSTYEMLFTLTDGTFTQAISGTDAIIEPLVDDDPVKREKYTRQRALFCKAIGVTDDELTRILGYCNLQPGDKFNEYVAGQLCRFGAIPRMLGLTFSEAEHLWILMGSYTVLYRLGKPEGMYAFTLIDRTKHLLTWMADNELNLIQLRAMVSTAYSNTATAEMFTFLQTVYHGVNDSLSPDDISQTDEAITQKLFRTLSGGFGIKANMVRPIINWLSSISDFTLLEYWKDIRTFFSDPNNTSVNALQNDTTKLVGRTYRLGQLVLICRWLYLNELDLMILTESPAELDSVLTTTPSPDEAVFLMSFFKRWQSQVTVRLDEAMRLLPFLAADSTTPDDAAMKIATIHHLNKNTVKNLGQLLFKNKGFPSNFAQLWQLLTWARTGQSLNVGVSTLNGLLSMAQANKGAENSTLIARVAADLTAGLSR